MKKKANLKDVTFLIPVRIDSKERLENLNMVVEFIKTNFDTAIVVLEADNEEQVTSLLIDKKIFVEDYDLVFHRTKFLNQMTRKCKTPYIAVWDTDVIIESVQIIEAVKKLRSGVVDFVFPFNGNFLNVPPIIRDLFFIKSDIDVLKHNINMLYSAYGSASVGGAFIANRLSYIKAGMENETFYGWGMEDAERVKRWEILGDNINRIDGPLFHLFHPRKQNSWFANREIEINNRKEFLRICKMTKEELSSEVNRWAVPSFKKRKKEKNNKIIASYFFKNKSPKLQIGCGYNPQKGWLNTDLNYSEELNVASLDAGKTFPFKDETFSFIYSEHIFEHLTLEESINMIKESYRVLKPNGYIRIATPDLDFLINLYQKKTLPIHKDYIKWSSGLFCNSACKITNDTELLSVYVINNFFKDWGHQIIHNFDTLKNLLEKSGFKNVTKEKIGISNIPALQNMEKHGEIIPSEFNELETLIIQAEK